MSKDQPNEDSGVSSEVYISEADALEAVELFENRAAGGFNKMVNTINAALNQYSKSIQTNIQLLRGKLGAELPTELLEYQEALEEQEAQMLAAFEEERARIEEIAAQGTEDVTSDTPEEDVK